MNKFESFNDEFKYMIERQKELTKTVPQLQAELERINTRLMSLKPDEMKQISIPWDGLKPLKGRIRWSDKKRWEAILQVDEQTFIYIGVAHLMETNRTAGIRLAQIFSGTQNQKFPPSGLSFGTVTISTSGNVELQSTKPIEALPDSYERKRSAMLQGI